MDDKKKEGRYRRLYEQLSELMSKTSHKEARMATFIALLHHKMDYFFWTGFYFLVEEDLVVSQYQGPLACQVLERAKGVCWAALLQQKVMIVEDVHAFPGHIACDARSNSEIVIPVSNRAGDIIGVLDIDSTEKGAFSETDALWLSKMLTLIDEK